VAPDTGSLEVGQTVRIGYYDQESRALDEQERVIDYIRAVAERIETADGTYITAGQMLEKFLFTGAMQYAPIAKLSGGERRRLYLLRVLMGAPNVLLLDEPTNDLDIQTLITLEDYLDGFPGNLIVVSHDRYFLDRTVEHIFRFEGEGRLREYPGNYSAFLEARRHEENDAPPAAAAASARPAGRERTEPSTARRKLSFKERQELAAAEARIEAAERRVAEIETELSANSSDAHIVHRLYEEREQLTEQLTRDLERWAELAELA
jgi:ATP-binding cassette subfamily F protein uup